MLSVREYASSLMKPRLTREETLDDIKRLHKATPARQIYPNRTQNKTKQQTNKHFRPTLQQIIIFTFLDHKRQMIKIHPQIYDAKNSGMKFAKIFSGRRNFDPNFRE